MDEIEKQSQLSEDDSGTPKIHKDVYGRTGKQRLRHFSFILACQVVSVFGSTLTAFALGVWAYQQAGSVTVYTLIYFVVAGSSAIAAPFAGSLIDRWNKKTVLMCSALGSALISLVIAFLYSFDVLTVWHIVGLALVNGVMMSFSKPAITAAVKMLIDEDDLVRANGIMATGFGLVTLVAPAIAGYLLLKIELIGILIIDLTTFIVGLAALVVLKLPPTKLAPEVPVWEGVKFAWGYLQKKSALLWLIGFYATINFFIGMIVIMLQPMVLSFSDSAGLGLVMTLGGFGYIFGAIFMSVWGGPKRKIYAIYGVAVLMCLGMVVAPMYTNIWIICLAAFLLSVSLPIAMTCNQAIVQMKVATEVIGRVDGLGTLFIGICIPFGYLIGGQFAELIFEPMMMQPTESLAWLNHLYGTGKGRGIAVMISVISIILLLIVFAAISHGKIRNIELELPNEK